MVRKLVDATLVSIYNRGQMGTTFYGTVRAVRERFEEQETEAALLFYREYNNPVNLLPGNSITFNSTKRFIVKRDEYIRFPQNLLERTLNPDLPEYYFGGGFVGPKIRYPDMIGLVPVTLDINTVEGHRLRLHYSVNYITHVP